MTEKGMEMDTEMEMEKRKSAVAVIQRAWRNYLPYHDLATLQRLLLAPPALASGEHDPMVRRLTTWMTSTGGGETAAKEAFIDRAQACGLYPFALTELKLESEGELAQSESGVAIDPSRLSPSSHAGAPEMLWSEMLHADNGLPLLKAASVPSLIQCLVSDSYCSLEPSFLEDFLLTYRTFLTPHTLLLLLILRYWVPLIDKKKRKDCIPIQIKTVRVLRVWIELVPSDFLQDGLLAQSATNFLTGIDTFKVASNEILKLLQEKMGRGMYHEESDDSSYTPPTAQSFGEAESKEDCLNEIHSPDTARSHRHRSKSSTRYHEPCLFLSFDAVDIAFEWTLISQRLYRSITPQEFIKQAWNKKTKNRDAPNVSSLIEDFNQMSEWVSLVILSYRDRKRRGAAISHFIQIAWECHQLKNYHSVMIILSGLTKAHITRLKRSWEFVDSKLKAKLKLLNEVMGMEANYQQYRQALREMTPATPSVPFLGLFLTDLTFLDEGNSDLMSSLERSASFSAPSPDAITSGATTPRDQSSTSVRTTSAKRRSLFKVKTERSLKPDSSKSASDDGATTSSSSIAAKQSEKRRSTIRSLSVYMRETSEKIRFRRSRKSNLFATLDESDLASAEWRKKSASSAALDIHMSLEAEEAARQAWRQLDEDSSKQQSTPRSARSHRTKRAPQIFDMNELAQLLEKEKEKEDQTEDSTGNTENEDESCEATVTDNASAVKLAVEKPAEAIMLVNWMKKRTMAKVLREFLRFQNSTYHLPKRREKRRRKQSAVRRRSKTERKSMVSSLDQIVNEGPKEIPLQLLTTSELGELAEDMGLSDDQVETIRDMLREMRLPPDLANVLDLSSMFPTAFPSTPQSTATSNTNSPKKRARSPSGSSGSSSSRSRSATSLNESSPLPPPLKLSDIISKPDDLLKSPRTPASARQVISPRNITQAIIKRSTSMPSITLNSVEQDIVTAVTPLTPRGNKFDISQAASAITELPGCRNPPGQLTDLLTMKYIKLDDNLLFDLSLHLEPRSRSHVGLNPPNDEKSLFVITPQSSPLVSSASGRVRDKIDRAASPFLAAPSDAESDGSGIGDLHFANAARRGSVSGPAAAVRIAAAAAAAANHSEKEPLRHHTSDSPCIPVVPAEDLPHPTNLLDVPSSPLHHHQEDDTPRKGKKKNAKRRTREPSALLV